MTAHIFGGVDHTLEGLEAVLRIDEAVRGDTEMIGFAAVIKPFLDSRPAEDFLR